MLRILGSPKTLCDGLTRRDLLRIGALGSLGLGDWLRLQAAEPQASATGAAGKSFGKAKSCILLFLFGSPSQHDTFDPKPHAPEEVRGELKPIATSVAGLQICELLPRIAKMCDRTTIVRSLTHPYPIHGVAYALTATPFLDIPMQLNPRDTRNWPFIGSVVNYLDEKQGRRRAAKVPQNIALPWLLSSRRGHPSRDAGPYGHFLGPASDPIWTDFQGEGTENWHYHPATKNQHLDPFAGVKPDCRFPLTAGEDRQDPALLARLDDRRALLRQFNTACQAMEAEALNNFDRHQQRAFSLLTSKEARAALDIQREPMAVREKYGMHLFGQASLVARRLIEAGARFATVFWDDYHHLQSAWDTHSNHFPKMRNLLCPGLDQTFTALLEDLEARGLLDETLVVCISEHGRTPRLDSKYQGGGRGHWSNVYSAIMAGGGFARGKVVGQSDRQGGEVADNPFSPKDILATMYHLLGIDPHTTVSDRLGRPIAIAGEGQVRPELLA
jgi:hypothetical protein